MLREELWKLFQECGEPELYLAYRMVKDAADEPS